MTPEKQRIAIAKSLGWDQCRACGMWVNPNTLQCETVGIENCTPDWLSDLNACHEMEKNLNTDQILTYSRLLSDIICRANRVSSFENFPSDHPWHSTAAQRCEAFLRVLNLWEES